MNVARRLAKPLLSPPEQRLYARLVRAFPGHVVLAHVALSRLLNAADLHGSAEFVVFNPDFTPLAVVELDAAIAEPELIDHRRRKDALLGAAGIEVLRVSAGDLPREAALKSLVGALPLRRAS